MTGINPQSEPVFGAIVARVLAAADAGAAVDRTWPAELDAARRVALIAAGKAAAPMARAAIARLGDRLSRGAIVCPPDHSALSLGAAGGALRVFPADHPLPTPRNLEAARAVADLANDVANAQARGSEDSELLLVLLSGGASAHLCLPTGALTLDDLRRTADALLRAGAPIEQVNAVRGHTEVLKGGGLARHAHPARVRCLIVSDVVGDRLELIGSGPTAEPTSTPADALRILDRYAIESPAIRRHLVSRSSGPPDAQKPSEPGHPRPGSPFDHCTNTIIASNGCAIEAARAAVRALGISVLEVRTGVVGEASAVGRAFGRELVALGNRTTAPAAIILGGETTVTVAGAGGAGGPCQELALAAALEIAGSSALRIRLLSFSTDGIDGPTDAAGAVVHSATATAIRAAGIDPDQALSAHNAHPALDAVGGLVRSGPTGTNVNDIAVGLVRPPA